VVPALEKLGGEDGLVKALNSHMTNGIAPSEVPQREEVFGKNYVEPDPPDTLLELAWEALQVSTLDVHTRLQIQSQTAPLWGTLYHSCTNMHKYLCMFINTNMHKNCDDPAAISGRITNNPIQTLTSNTHTSNTHTGI